MASLTIRKLDEAVKAYLRLRSARNGRSVEEEVRVILREADPGSPDPPPPARQPSRRPKPRPARPGARLMRRIRPASP